MSVGVVTDSTAYLPRELVADLGITQVSLYYGFDRAGDREVDLTDHAAFYAELEGVDAPALTAPPSVDDFAATYESLLADGSSVVSIHISSALSDACMNAREAATRLAAEGRGGERVAVVDSAGTGGSLGLVTLAAQAVARRGEDHEAVLRRANEARQETQMRFLVDSLEYLRRGGRIGTAASWLGSALDIKPILSVQSEIKAVERVRTRERAIERLVEWGRRQVAAGSDAWCVQHATAPDGARELVDRLREVFWRPPEFVGEIGPVVGTHTGPGVLVLGTMPSRFLD